MTNEHIPQDSKNRAASRPAHQPEHPEAANPQSPAQKIQRIQRDVGNRGVQRMLAQREGGAGGPFEVDDETQGRINNLRGSGQPLDVGIQQRMQDAMGYDFSGVNVHTSAEASSLSQALQAKAFTTGSDIFFNESAYQPHTADGQELLAHELTHVVQQGSGQVTGGGGAMTVNAPGDSFEQQADAAAREVMSSPAGGGAEGVQRQEMPEEEEPVQTKALQSTAQREGLPEEEVLQGKRLDAVQREGLPEEEQALQMQELEDDELEQGT